MTHYKCILAEELCIYDEIIFFLKLHIVIIYKSLLLKDE